MISTTAQMAADLRNLCIRERGVLLVHSSLRSLGKIDGGAETVIRALLDVLGEYGTLLMPALSYRTVTSEHPYFDVRTTPSCVGALTEYFRQRKGTQRSIHPTHSVCGVGEFADNLLSGHENDTTPCGQNSPFRKLSQYNGQILFIGCGLGPDTSMHAIEELSEPPYLYSDVLDYTVTNKRGKSSSMSIRRHNFDGWVQRYDRLAQILDENSLCTGKVLDADCHLVEITCHVNGAAHQKLKADPFFFVDREEYA